MEKNDIEKALNLAYFYLKFRFRSTREMERYLQRKAEKYRYSPAIIPQVIKNLQEGGYLNDKRFTEMYIHDRLLFKPRSVFLLKKELENLGIEKDIILSYFETHQIDNKTSADVLLKKKWLSLSHLAPKDRFARAMRYLKGKGFSYGDSLSAYRSLESESANPFEE